MKKGLLAILGILAIGYLIFSMSYFKDKSGEEICSGLEIEISNANNNQFINTAEVANKLKDEGLDPTGKKVNSIKTIDIEEAVLKDQHIKQAAVFVTNDNVIKIIIEERKPIIRIISNSGESYYIDEEAQRIPLSRRYTAYLPVATGEIKESFAKEELYKFALFLQKHKFWNAQVEQIVVKPNEDIEFVTRVGNQTVVLGSMDNVEKKLNKLNSFYQDGLNRIGWNKYSIINLKFDKQVVCTKR